MDLNVPLWVPGEAVERSCFDFLLPPPCTDSVRFCGDHLKQASGYQGWKLESSYLCLEATLSVPSSLVVLSASFCYMVSLKHRFKLPQIRASQSCGKIDEFILTPPALYNMHNQHMDGGLSFSKLLVCIAMKTTLFSQAQSIF